jgi:hypothetical protein
VLSPRRLSEATAQTGELFEVLALGAHIRYASSHRPERVGALRAPTRRGGTARPHRSRRAWRSPLIGVLGPLELSKRPIFGGRHRRSVEVVADRLPRSGSDRVAAGACSLRRRESRTQQ